MTKPRLLSTGIFLLSALLVSPLAISSATAAPTTTNLPDGLRIIDTTVGTGPEVTAGATVIVNYVGYLDADGQKGEKFDASADHGDAGFTFTLGTHDVIAGWDEGVLGMKVGGKRTLIVPPDLGYGAKQAGKIAPWSTLIFDIELRDVK